MNEDDEIVKEEYFDIPYLTLLKNACCQKYLTDENKLRLNFLSYAENYIHKRLDIAFYLKLLVKFENLQKMLLTTNERLLFKFTKKPKIKIPKSKTITKLFDQEKNKDSNEFNKVDYNTENLERKKSLLNMLNPALMNYLSKHMEEEKIRTNY